MDDTSVAFCDGEFASDTLMMCPDTLGQSYRGTSLIKDDPLVGPYSTTIPEPYGDPGGKSVSYERGDLIESFFRTVFAPVPTLRGPVACRTGQSEAF